MFQTINQIFCGNHSTIEVGHNPTEIVILLSVANSFWKGSKGYMPLFPPNPPTFWS